MTKDYLINACALNFNNSASYNFQGYRKGMYVQLLAMFLVYFAGQIYQAIKSSPMDQSQAKAGQQQPRIELPWHEKRWNKLFPIHFANHSVGLGFVLLFFPMPAGLIIAYLHFIFFVLHVVFELRMNQLIAGIMLGMMSLCNVVLMLIGLIGMTYSNFENSTSSVCKYPRV